MSKIFIVLFLACICGLATSFTSSKQKHQKHRPKISFSFDDGSTNDMCGYKLETWNEMLLNNLKKHHLKAVLFSTGKNKKTEKGKYLLATWDKAGHLIGNHTLNHPNFNSTKVSLSDFELELLSNDSIIKSYKNYYPYFRFPYLKEGDTKEKIEGFRTFLKQKNYKTGHVSIDASDWYIDSRLVKRLQENPQADLTGFRDYYKKHLLNRARYYDSLAFELTQRHINHVILLHHNLAAALFLDDLLQYFKQNGWELIDIDEAYQDKIYEEVPQTFPAGESLIWSLAKQSGRFDKNLRYPAEDGEYEKPIMDKLGL